MTEPIVNIPLLRKAVEWVEAQAALPVERREWDQTGWRRTYEDRQAVIGGGCGCEPCRQYYAQPRCGTTYCVAGHLVVEAGYEWSSESNSYLANGRRVDDVAADMLGLGFGQASHLFNASNNARTVRRIAEDIAGERL